jgi:TonB-dependent receptor
MAVPGTTAWDGLTGKFKFGPAFTFRDRNSNLRQFQYRPRGANVDLTAPPEVILDPTNILDNQLTFQENTNRKDSFHATEEIAAIYSMFDLPLWSDWLRLVAGVRTEYSYIDLQTYSEDKEPADATFNQTTIINNTDPIPGVNLILTPRSDMNVRAGFSKTVSRPEFRELSPIQFPEPQGLRTTVGNPLLVEAHVTNYDLRWEWFFTPLELASASFFYKALDKPIETILVPVGSTNANSFANAEDGDVWGFELEGRKNFGFLADELAPVTVTLNAAYIRSTVTLPEDPVLPPGTPDTPLTTRTHELQGQSPYVINAALEYATPDFGTARFLYVTSGERIVSLGYYPLANIIEQPRNQLDFVWFKRLNVFDQPVTAKLSLENLWNDHYLFKQGDLVTGRYRTGVKVGLSFSYDFS